MKGFGRGRGRQGLRKVERDWGRRVGRKVGKGSRREEGWEEGVRKEEGSYFFPWYTMIGWSDGGWGWGRVRSRRVGREEYWEEGVCMKAENITYLATNIYYYLHCNRVWNGEKRG